MHLRTTFDDAARDVVALRAAVFPPTTVWRIVPLRAVVGVFRTTGWATALRETFDVFVVVRRTELRATVSPDARPVAPAPFTTDEFFDWTSAPADTRTTRFESLRGDAETFTTFVAERGLGAVSAFATPATNAAAQKQKNL